MPAPTLVVTGLRKRHILSLALESVNFDLEIHDFAPFSALSLNREGLRAYLCYHDIGGLQSRGIAARPLIRYRKSLGLPIAGSLA